MFRVTVCFLGMVAPAFRLILLGVLLLLLLFLDSSSQSNTVASSCQMIGRYRPDGSAK